MCFSRPSPVETAVTFTFNVYKVMLDFDAQIAVIQDPSAEERTALSALVNRLTGTSA
jgi:hypothetical protein